MSSKNTIVINGKVYDAITGLPVAAPRKAAPVKTAKKVAVSSSKPQAKVATAKKPVVTPHAINYAHRSVQKSTTLRRDIVKKPVSTTHPIRMTSVRKVGHVAKSPMINKFAPHPKPIPETKDLHTTPIRPKLQKAQVDPVVARIHERVQKHPVQPSAHTQRQKALMNERLAKVSQPTNSTRKVTKPKRSLFARKPRVANVLTVSLAVMVLGGYLTYLSLPGLSVRVAASQAGIAASFPDYHPDGYRFNGPVSFAPGQVAIKFQSNGSDNAYTITQQKSTWDSQAVYDNVVAKIAGDDYITNSQNGLTIYTFNDKAAWVNKGTLYTINGSASLSNEQMLRIAASL